jgi:phosphoglycerate dehydrogenase-like enzyme
MEAPKPKGRHSSQIGRPRCLLAFSEKEKRLLVGDEQWEAIRGVVGEVIEVPLDDLPSENWRQILIDSRCEILVGAWSMPAIPDDFPLGEHPLRYVCSLVGGVKSRVPRKFVEQGLLVTNWGSAISRTIAESALMLILMALRRTAHWHEVLHHQKGWRSFPEGAQERSLFERQVGLHGFGRIAQELVGLLRPFGVRCSTHCPSIPDEVLEAHGVERMNSLEALFSQNDIVVELAGHTAETERSVTEKILRLMPEDGVFVNVGRGAVVDEAALVRVAREGRIRVALDVYAVEPLPVDSPLRELYNVVLMPHQSGPTPDRMRDVGAFALENLRRYCAGEAVQARIEPFLYDYMT